MNADNKPAAGRSASCHQAVSGGEPNAEREYLVQLLQRLATHVRREQLETWFRSLDVIRLTETEVEVSVTSQFVRDWLQRNFLAVLQTAAEEVDRLLELTKHRVQLGHRDEDAWDGLAFAGLDSPGNQRMGANLDVVLDPIREQFSPSSGTPSRELIGSQSGEPHRAYDNRPAGIGFPSNLKSGPADGSGPRLNPNYTFDKFVVGSCNRLAHASAIAIAENPGFAYNPLFVHGNVGLGKSHLLQAICHTISKRTPDARVVYMSCEDFTNAFIQAIQSHRVEDFRQYYRDADVLVIDDVQFLAHKDKTQAEFFHTFNALYDGQKQIVLSSDRPPVEIPTIEERLVSRFKWGLVAEVEAPCFDTRKAIVQRKAQGRGTELPDDVASFLAERVATNIRELEGAVIKVVGIAAITSQPITLALAESCMRGLPVRTGHVSADDVMSLITSEFAISARELTGKSRTQMVSLPRQVAMFLIREHSENSLEDVGRIFGNRDHTTVLYAVNKIKSRLKRDRTFKDLIESLSNRLLTRGFR
ncbi:MAG: chromosomal replication initiator protein DnaA [Planctomycetes bacterium]|nr:chromosomal replication initiator protein DnaA [Planctomycetota bacterium]